MTRNTAADYQRCADAGMTAKQTARYLGVSYSSVTGMKKRHGIAFRRNIAKGWAGAHKNQRIGTVSFDAKLHSIIADMAVSYRVSFSEMVCILCDKSLETYTIKHKE